MAQPSVHGRFIWQELLTQEPAAAASFYPRVLGWRTRASAVDASYTEFLSGTDPVAGMMQLPAAARDMGARPHWLPYVGVADVDGTVATAVRLGAKVLRPATDIEQIGRFAVLADPQGASFAIYAPTHPAVPKGPPKPGHASWMELAANDYEAAFDFYRELFGWQPLQRMEMGPAGVYLIFGIDGVQMGGIYKLSAQMPAPYWLAYISVPDADAAAAAAQSAGGRIINGPMDVPGGGRIAQVLDPGGVLFALHSAVAAAKPAAKQAAAKPAATKSVPQAPKKAVKKAAKKPAKKAVKKVAKKVAKKAAKKAAKKKVAKKAKRVTKSARKTAAKSVRKVSRSARAGKKRAAAKRRQPARRKK